MPTAKFPGHFKSLAGIRKFVYDAASAAGFSDKEIYAVELAVATPVQAVVKRRDEQEFARLNGENLMFCEDSARRIRLALDQIPEFVDYRIQASHLESLHPHDAV
ncbi:MAG: GTP cyclohydrolase, FolE2/MptA family, partial [Anaerolineales bacterium]